MGRVSKLVQLASFLAANPGVTVREAALATGRTSKQLSQDLGALLMCGVPPFSPSDYIGFVPPADDDSPIELFAAEHFAAPPTFTPQEALALRYALDHCGRSADPETLQELVKLNEVVAAALHGKARESVEGEAPGFVTPRRTMRMRTLLADLLRAAEERRVCEIEYFSSHRAELTTRRIRPREVSESGAHFYLSAWCETAGDERLFRLDRIRRATVLEETFSAIPPRSAKGKARTGKLEKMVLEISGPDLDDFEEDWRKIPGVQVERKDDLLRIETGLFNSFWVAGLVASLGKRIRVVSPKALREDVRATLRRSLAMHGIET